MAGRRIDDHSSWVGKAESGEVVPKGVKVKHEMGAEGDGNLSEYEDTADKIVSQQKMSVSKLKSHKQRPLHRN